MNPLVRGVRFVGSSSSSPRRGKGGGGPSTSSPGRGGIDEVKSGNVGVGTGIGWEDTVEYIESIGTV